MKKLSLDCATIGENTKVCIVGTGNSSHRVIMYVRLVGKTYVLLSICTKQLVDGLGGPVKSPPSILRTSHSKI